MTNTKSSSEAPKKVLLVGMGIARSISPAIQNSAFRKLGLNVEYNSLELKEREFEKKIGEILETEDLIGLNVTVPFKERIIKHLTEIDSRSRSIRAVNTVKISKSKSMGFNTDYDGIMATFSSLGVRDNQKSNNSLVMGAGGAARACVYALAKSGFGSIAILNRTPERARELAEHFSSCFPKVTIAGCQLTSENVSKHLKGCDLLINAITMQSPNQFPIKLELSEATRKMKVFDLGYREPSLLLRTAMKQGLRSSDGLLMLVEQAARSIEIWTGKSPPRKEMFASALSGQRRSKVG